MLSKMKERGDIAVCVCGGVLYIHTLSIATTIHTSDPETKSIGAKGLYVQANNTMWFSE